MGFKLPSSLTVHVCGFLKLNHLPLTPIDPEPCSLGLSDFHRRIVCTLDGLHRIAYLIAITNGVKLANLAL